MKRYYVFEGDMCEDKRTLLNVDTDGDIQTVVKHADVAAVVNEYTWRSVYPTKDGYWWHRGPSGTFIRRVRLCPDNLLGGLYPYDCDTNEGLWNIDGEWAPALAPTEAQRLLAELEGM